MGEVIGSVICPAACAANTMIPVPSRVCFIERMAVLAMGLARLSRSESVATQQVFPTCNSFKMPWPDASPHAAQVVDFFTGRDWPVGQFIGEAVCPNELSVNAENSIAAGVGCSSPEPTRLRLMNFGEEAFNYSVHVRSIAHGS